MTKDKAQKRAIRTRMAKTGERYTAARHYHLDQHLNGPSDPEQQAEQPETAPTSPAAPPRVAEPGMSEEAVRRGTGKGWDEWLSLLDAWGAAARSHPEIARYLVEEHGVGGWWAQSVTVGYERARGMRDIHQVTDGFAVGISKTLPVPVSRLFRAFVDDDARDRWLEPGTLRARTARPDKSARFDVLGDGEGTRLEINFMAKGEAKASVQIQHVKLPSKSDVEPWRAFWKERLNRLATALRESEDETVG